jgi:hypothetical protein
MYQLEEWPPYRRPNFSQIRIWDVHEVDSADTITVLEYSDDVVVHAFRYKSVTCSVVIPLPLNAKRQGWPDIQRAPHRCFDCKPGGASLPSVGFRDGRLSKSIAQGVG